MAGLPAPTPQHTIHELVTEYRLKVTPRKSPASQRRDHVVLERFNKRWGTLDLDQLRTKTVEDYLTERLHDVTLATVSKELGILRSAYARAITMTMRYAHLAPSHLRAGIQALEQRNPKQQTGHALSTVTLESRYFPENA